MDAAVLMPDVRAELEVQKLQELVRKLERQNEQLRSRANIAPPASSCCVPSPASNLAYHYFPPDDPFSYFQPHSAAEEDDEPRALLDQLEILDLDIIFPSYEESEETWLYVSPRSLWSGEVSSALDWCRRVLDQQRSDVNTRKQTLQSVNRWRSGLSPAYPRARVVGVSPLCTSSKPSTPDSCTAGGVRRAPLSQVSPDVSVMSDDDSLSLSYKLQDLTDVQVMARLQEESLRQDFTTTTSSSSSHNRRSASFSFQFVQRAESHEEEEDDDEDYDQLPPPQPRLSRAGSLRHSHTFSGVRDWRGPQYTAISPYQPQSASNTSATSSSEQTDLRISSDKLRRSLPNLLRSPSVSSISIPVSQISSSIRNSQSFDSSVALGRLQTAMSSPGQLRHRVQSVGNFSSRPSLKATAYVSPTVKGSSSMTSSLSLQSLSTAGSPQPSKAGGSQIPARSALPRPASFVSTASTPRSKLATPVRSLLTPPKSLMTLSALRDGSWRDGCY
ncbi:SLAIN motif-containing protein 1 [Paramisgurnus dabryanus]|uniref:SLAIN motif-containing protein 1 n=1 Tax=Paramisgurnus dabryanus TaxID=90735 RepID=UPI0031F3BF1A